MKPKEAITLVKECGLNIEGIKCDECEKVILNALEKQIPKKVIVKKYDIGGNDYFCPCGNQIKSGQYCSECGCALDWSDTE
jgi:hypothetical protein